MRSLLDVSLLIALLDPDHAFQEPAHRWLSLNIDSGWASCPLTENGVVRIMSTPGYSRKMQFSPNDIIGRLREFIDKSDHEFWPDRISLLDKTRFVPEHIHSPKYITDLYLLALAVKHDQKLVTFDQRISLSAVSGAKPENLCIL